MPIHEDYRRRLIAAAECLTYMGAHCQLGHNIPVVARSTRPISRVTELTQGGSWRERGPRSPGRTRYGKAATIGAAAITCLWYGPFSIQSDRAGNTPAAGCPPTVSLSDGHGMILIERCVDIEDTTYRVVLGKPGPLKNSGP